MFIQESNRSYYNRSSPFYVSRHFSQVLFEIHLRLNTVLTKTFYTISSMCWKRMTKGANFWIQRCRIETALTVINEIIVLSPRPSGRFRIGNKKVIILWFLRLIFHQKNFYTRISTIFETSYYTENSTIFIRFK